MRPILLVAALASLVACRRSRPATAADCQQGCAHAAPLQIAPQKANIDMNVHEADEKVDAIEATSKQNIDLLRQQLAQATAPDESPFAKLPAAQRKQIAERHKWEADVLRTQREQGIRNAEKAVEDAKKDFARIQAEAGVRAKKLLDDATAACISQCTGKTQAYANCLTRIQAVEDMKLCERR